MKHKAGSEDLREAELVRFVFKVMDMQLASSTQENETMLEKSEVESRRVFKMIEIVGGIVDVWAASSKDARWCNCVVQRSCGDGLCLSLRV